jgi:hypothetical protein
MCESLDPREIDIVLGDQDLEGRSAEFVYVAKPPVMNNSRLGDWCRYLERLGQTGAIIACDYSDNHLSKHSSEPAYRFYQRVLSLSDIVVVPTQGMGEWLVACSWSHEGKIRVVPDWNEFEDLLGRAPEQRKPEKLGLWFGHPTNLPHLEAHLSSNSNILEGEKIVLITSAKAIQQLGWKAEQWLLWPGTNTWVKPVAWNREVMRENFRSASYCIIPSDPVSLRKKFASPNRLVAALSAGLPTTATLLDGNEELSDFFVPLGSPTAKDLVANPAKFNCLAARFGVERYLSYRLDSVTKQWRQALDVRSTLDRKTRAAPTSSRSVGVANHEL